MRLVRLYRSGAADDQDRALTFGDLHLSAPLAIDIGRNDLHTVAIKHDQAQNPALRQDSRGAHEPFRLPPAIIGFRAIGKPDLRNLDIVDQQTGTVDRRV